MEDKGFISVELLVEYCQKMADKLKQQGYESDCMSGAILAYEDVIRASRCHKEY